jgi:hypothetical protein
VLDVSTVPLSSLTIRNGQGPDVVVQNGGVFRHNIAANSSLPSFAVVATLEVQSGGILEAANNNGTPGITQTLLPPFHHILSGMRSYI